MNRTASNAFFYSANCVKPWGKDKERVDWVWLVNDAAPVDPAMQKPLADAIVLRVAQTTLDQWLLTPTGRSASDFLFVVDPLGNTMDALSIPL